MLEGITNTLMLESPLDKEMRRTDDERHTVRRIARGVYKQRQDGSARLGAGGKRASGYWALAMNSSIEHGRPAGFRQPWCVAR